MTDLLLRDIDPILADLKPASGTEVLLFVNGMGGTPEAELYIVYNHARARLEAAGAVSCAADGLRAAAEAIDRGDATRLLERLAAFGRERRE